MKKKVSILLSILLVLLGIPLFQVPDAHAASSLPFTWELWQNGVLENSTDAKRAIMGKEGAQITVNWTIDPQNLMDSEQTMLSYATQFDLQYFNQNTGSRIFLEPTAITVDGAATPISHNLGMTKPDYDTMTPKLAERAYDAPLTPEFLAPKKISLTFTLPADFYEAQILLHSGVAWKYSDPTVQSTQLFIRRPALANFHYVEESDWLKNGFKAKDMYLVANDLADYSFNPAYIPYPPYNLPDQIPPHLVGPDRSRIFENTSDSAFEPNDQAYIRQFPGYEYIRNDTGSYKRLVPERDDQGNLYQVEAIPFNVNQSYDFYYIYRKQNAALTIKKTDNSVDPLPVDQAYFEVKDQNNNFVVEDIYGQFHLVDSQGNIKSTFVSTGNNTLPQAADVYTPNYYLKLVRDVNGGYVAIDANGKDQNGNSVQTAGPEIGDYIITDVNHKTMLVNQSGLNRNGNLVLQDMKGVFFEFSPSQMVNGKFPIETLVEQNGITSYYLRDIHNERFAINNDGSYVISLSGLDKTYASLQTVNGKIALNRLPYGTYTVREIVPAPSYDLTSAT